MKKKGAIEFSMTTIIVVIIGVLILALAIPWLQKTFSRVGQITDVSLDNAETILAEVAFTGKVSAPATIILDKDGDAKKFKVLVKNIRNEEDTFGLTISTSTLGCIITQVPGGDVKIQPNEVGELTGGLIAKNCDKGSGIVTIKVEGDSNPDYATEAIAVQVE